jgi:hypothetical protein
MNLLYIFCFEQMLLTFSNYINSRKRMIPARNHVVTASEVEYFQHRTLFSYVLPLNDT